MVCQQDPYSQAPQALAESLVAGRARMPREAVTVAPLVLAAMCPLWSLTVVTLVHCVQCALCGQCGQCGQCQAALFSTFCSNRSCSSLSSSGSLSLLSGGRRGEENPEG